MNKALTSPQALESWLEFNALISNTMDVHTVLNMYLLHVVYLGPLKDGRKMIIAFAMHRSFLFNFHNPV